MLSQCMSKVFALLIPDDTSTTFRLRFIALMTVSSGQPVEDKPTLILRPRQFLQPFLDFLWDLRGL